MTVKIKIGGTFINLATMKIRSGGSWIGASTARRRSGGSWTTVWTSGPLSAYALPSSINASRTSAGIISDFLAIVVSGGSGSYTYSSSWLSGGAGITITDSTTSSPGVSSSGAPELTRTGTVRTVVSDGITSVNVDWAVQLQWSNL